MKTFTLPDLGEGLAEAEIVEWKVQVGDEVQENQPLVAMETDKAVVDIPSPYAGKIQRCFGKPGDIVRTGAPLVQFQGAETETRADTGTVVGELQAGEEVLHERTLGAGHGAAVGVKTTPAVRALARRLEVDLSVVTPTGPDGTISRADVERVARILQQAGPLEMLRGVRRSMARKMTHAHAEVVPVSLSDDADIQSWREKSDITLRLIRALLAGCQAEPALNAWYDGHAVGRRVLREIHLGIAVDSAEGLFVAVLRNAEQYQGQSLRAELERLKQAVGERSLPPEQMRGYSITLSNFGMIAGRYATPIVLPPTVAILGAGRIRSEAVVVDGQVAVHRILPLSLSFDHRAVTGGEAGRFLAAVIADLQQAE